MAEEGAYWNLLGFVLASEKRREVLLCLEKKNATPKQISLETKISQGHVSNILIDLVKKKIIVCKNPDAVRGRIYALTELGRKIVSSMEKAGYAP